MGLRIGGVAIAGYAGSSILRSMPSVQYRNRWFGEFGETVNLALSTAHPAHVHVHVRAADAHSAKNELLCWRTLLKLHTCNYFSKIRRLCFQSL